MVLIYDTQFELLRERTSSYYSRIWNYRSWL